MTDHAQLLAMTYQGRVDWMNQRKAQIVGRWMIKVDGHLAAISEDDEPEEDLIARFLMFLARRILPCRTGGMG